ncbi:MAG TPA: D-alanyl-D-alanine carboxypeptidase/D-alanyl-D-alanine-endopeptidase [Nevskiaceae bacterium]|nr:D-alanyl-D-alanine carboxypeptidase/D-alanyl-D-alanine-endopeptidase [Nevskiaceae bacterium]
MSRADGLPGLQALAAHGASVSARVVDLDDGDTIASIDPSLRLTPASLTKLVTAAAAFTHWNADTSFTTRLLINGEIDNGRVHGDLILQGGGDSTLDDADLWSLAAQLRGAGINAVDGSLLVVPAPFGPMACGTPDRCKALKRSDTAYNAEISSIGIDFGNWCVTVHPTAPGNPARVSACATARLPIPVNGDIQTVGARGRQSFWVERRTTADGDSLQIGGNIPVGQPVNVYRAMSNPARGTGLVLAEILREIGVHFSGRVVVTSRVATQHAFGVAEVKSRPLRNQLDSMLRYSNNYIADVTTLDLASDLSRVPPTTLSEAGSALANFVARSNQQQGQSTSPPPLYSGSGLTPDNRLSANDLVNLLTTMYHDPRNFPAFYGGLVVPREAPFAFLRSGDNAWLDRVTLKTGTMNDPRSVFGIAGYARKRKGGWLAFAMIVNGSERVHHIPLYKALAAARGDLQAILARH